MLAKIEQFPSIVGEIIDLKGASQSCCCNVTHHILAVEHYVKDTAWRESSHWEETSRCASELIDVHLKLEALEKEFGCFQHITQKELSKGEYLTSAAKANIVKLKDNFVNYNNHLKLVLEEILTALCKDIEKKLLLESQTQTVPDTAKVSPEMEEVHCQIDSLAILNNDAFFGNQQATQEPTLEEHREEIVHCGALIERLHSAIRGLEAQLAEVRSELQEGRCRCAETQFSILCVPHVGSGESTILHQPISSVYEDNVILSPS
ncbi:hypothetical protein DSO57_1002095 [Entomophthora muscae]|uniref:Uncharacterized protein n=1 Tax=Entomophthora muscae TaxID=34485 RepID=A0ACC2RZZ4_9FUNG|nr:hypothetical protein DSO57_1002095 [Entomophthora muscae]